MLKINQLSNRLGRPITNISSGRSEDNYVITYAVTEHLVIT